MSRLSLIAFAAVAFAGLPAHARSVACVDSFGTVIQGVKTPAACKKLGARWAKPGSKSLPKDPSAAGKHKKKRRGGGTREAFQG